MAITHPFRSTPQLGPGITTWDTHYWYDVGGVDVSYRLGNKEFGTDGHEYIMVQAGAELAAGARVDIAEETFEATAAGSGDYQVSPDLQGGPVPEGAYFQARKFAL